MNDDPTIASLEAQLVDLYKGNEHLLKELGTADADQILAMVKSLEAQLGELAHHQAIESLELQLNDLYRQREELHKALGMSDPVAIVRMVKQMESQLVEFYRTRDAALTAA